MNHASRHLRISGRVQGVGYRAWLAKQAGSLGLRGWVRNRADGTVEAVLLGPANALDAMLQACHRGPLLAKVSAVTASETAPGAAGDDAGVSILPTA